MTRRFLTSIIARSRRSGGFAILQAMAVVVVASALMTGMTMLILLEVEAQQQSVTMGQQQDVSDGAMGWIAASLGQADLPLKATGSSTVTYTVGAISNPPGTCYQISLNSVSHVLSIKGATYSGSGDCSLELGSAGAQTLASTIVNDVSKPVFTYYSTQDTTAPIADASNATTAKSVDVNLNVQGTNTNNPPLATLYHLVFGGSVTTPKLQDQAVVSTKVANNAVACQAALAPSPQQCDSSNAYHTTSSVTDNSINSSASDSYAFRSFSRAASISGTAVNYGPARTSQTGHWQTNQTSPAASGLSAGAGAKATLSVNWSDLCVPGKALYARGVYTILNPTDASGPITVGARMMEIDNSTGTAATTSGYPDLTNATSTFQVAPGAATADGGYSLLESGWRQIDAGACAGSNDLLNNDPYWYVLETEQSSPSGTIEPYALINAAVEIRYTPAASVSGSQPPDAPTLVSPADDTFAYAAKPTLKARFSDPNNGDTGQLTFQICSDAVCGTVLYSGNSVAGIANGATGSWQVPSNLPDGTYYWRAQATDSTALVGPWSSTNIVKVAATTPSISIDNPPTAITGAGAQYYDSGTKTLWFSTSTAATGSFSVAVHANGDPTTPSVWPIDTIVFPSLGTGWTGSGTVSSPSVDGSGYTSPDPSQTYSWSATAGSVSPATVTVNSVDGLSATDSLQINLDVTAPSGGSISYTNGTFTGTAHITGSTGTDSGAGMGNGGTVQESTEPWSSGCPSSWSAWSDLPSMPLAISPSYDVSVNIVDGTCYKFRYVATDRVGNQEVVTSTSVIQGGNPPVNTAAPTITDNQGHNPPQEGDTLTASTGSWTGDPTITYQYQWQRCGYKNVVLGDSPTAYWRLGESSGTFAADATGNSNAGTYNGSPTLAQPGALSGDPNTAVTFNGSNSINIPANSSRDLTGAMTFEAWVYPTVSSSGYQTVYVSRGSSGLGMDYGLYIHNGNADFNYYNGSGWFNSDLGAVPTNQWTYIVVTRDSSGSTISTYINGSLAGTTAGIGTASSSGNGNAATIGNDPQLASSAFTGSIDEAAVYPSALSGARILAHYQAGSAGTGLCADISGATSSTYAPNNDAGTTLLVKVTASNPVGSVTAQSTQTGWVTAIAPSNTAVPTVTDNNGNNPPQQGDVMAATTGSWLGTGNSYSYQWQRCNTLPGQILADSPAIYYRFDENGGAGYAFDSSGNARDGVYAGSPSTGTAAGPAGAAGHSVGFAGVNSYVQAPNPNIGGAFTLEAWVDITGTGSTGSTTYDTIMGTQTSQRLLWEAATSRLVAQINGVTLYSTGTVPTGGWHLVDFVYDGSNEYWYIDGAASGSQAATTLTWPGPFRLGAYDVDNYMLNGSLDEAAVYPSALSAARISAHYSAGTTACSNIGGATSSTYTTASADANSTLRVVVSATNAIGSASANSTQTATVGAAAPTPLVAPTISGSVSQGSVLTTNNGSFSGTTPINYTYQWQRVGYAGAVEADNPYLYLRLNETSGTAASDTMLNDSGLYVGSPTLGQGPATLDGDRSVLLNGSSQYVQLNSTVQFDSGNFTVEGWFNASSNPASNYDIWESGYNGGTTYLGLWINSTGHLVGGAESSGTSLLDTSTGTVTDGLWHYFAFVRSGSTFSLYVDSAAAVTNSAALGDVDAAGTNPTIGRNENGAIEYFSGHIDDIAAYKSALSSAQIAAHYTAGTSIGVNISGETAAAHTIVSADGDTNLRAIVTASNGSGSAKAGATPVYAPPPPANVSPPTTSGLAQVGQTINTTLGSWRGSGITYTYQWQDCDLTGGACTNIAGATSSTYTPVASDVGHTLVFKVTASNSGGSTTAASSYAISGESYRQAVVDDMPLDYWRLGEGSGTVATDETGANNGTYFNTPTFGQPSPLLGTSNTSITFNGTNQYMTAAPAQPGLQSWTVEAWEKVAAPGAGQYMVAGSSSGGPQLVILPTNGYAQIGAYNGAAWTTATGTTNVADGSWHYLVGTWDGSALSIYVDGALQTAVAASITNQWVCPLQIGGMNCSADGYSGQYLPGSIDEVALYDHALTSTQVTRHWRAHVTAAVYQTPQNAGGANAPTLSGDPQTGQLLTGASGNWTGSPTISFAQQWQRCGYSADVLKDSPLGYWRFDEPGGTSYYDSSGNNRAAGSYFGTVTLGQTGALVGDSNTAAAFDGNSYSSVPYGAWMDQPQFSAEMWIKPAAASQTAGARIAGREDSGTEWFLGYTNPFDGHMRFVVNNSVGSQNVATSTTALTSTSTWYHVVGTFDGSTVRIYINGKLEGSTAFSGTFVTATDKLSWGGDTGSTARFNGTIDDGAYYGSALSGGQIAYHYQAGTTSGGFCRNISGATGTTYTATGADVGSTLRFGSLASNGGGTNVAYSAKSPTVVDGYSTRIAHNGANNWYRLGEASGTTANDSSGNAYNGTYTGTVTLGAPGAISGDANTAVTLDGSTGYVNTPTTGMSAATFSVETWVKFSSVTQQGIYSQAQGINNSSDQAMRIRTDSSGDLCGGIGWVADHCTSAPLRTGQWYFVALTRTSGNTWTLYQDGVSVLSWSDATADSVYRSDIGRFSNGVSWFYLNGTIDEFSYYNYSLSSTQIQSDFNAGTGPNLVVSNPVVTGIAQETQVLSSTTGVFNGVQPRTYSYQWQRCDSAGNNCSAIGGATSSTYTVQNADIGSTLRSQVTMSNPAGSLSATSAATAAVLPAPPVNTATPALSGYARNGDTLSTSNGSWTGATPISYAYQWQRCDKYAATVKADSPYAYWRLGESSGTTAVDAMSAGHNGSYSVSNVTYGLSSLNSACSKAVKFAASGSNNDQGGAQVSIPDDASGYGSWSYTHAWTVEGWVNVGNDSPNTSGDFVLFGKGDLAANAQGWGVVIRDQFNTGCPVIDVYIQHTNVDPGGRILRRYGVNGSNSCGTDIWSSNYFESTHYIAVTYSGSGTSSGVSLYVDGSLISSYYDVDTSLSGADTNTSAAEIGGNFFSYSSGTVDDVALYSTALTSVQISNHWAARQTTATDIASATASSYTLAAGDVGFQVRAKVTASNAGGGTVAYTTPTTAVQDTYPNAMSATSPSSYWRLDELAGTTAADSSGNSHTGTYNSPSLGASGAIVGDTDTALGAGSATGALFGVTGDFSMAGWVYLTSGGGYTQVLNNGDGSGATGGYGLYADTANPCGGACSDGHAACPTASAGYTVLDLFVSSDDLCVISATVSLNAWHYVVFTHSGSANAGTWKIYVDGVVQSSITSNGTQPTGIIQHVPSTGNLIGNAALGTVDEVAFWSATALSQTQITTLYQNATIPVLP